MMANRSFSVSMCVYGKDDPIWFETAVESVLNQTVKPQEVVLVVDGPVPGDLDKVIKKYESTEVFKIIRFKENCGHGNARRASLDACSNELVAIMDADDICLPNRFEQQLDLMEKTEADIVGGNISEFVDSAENIVAYRNLPTEDKEIKEYMKKRCPFNQVTVMFKKKAAQDVGGYIDWYCDEDYYLWLRMAQNNCKMANTGTVLVNVRVGKEMYNRRGGIKYFRSEAKLQKYMLDSKIIGFGTYFVNVAKRFIVQVMLPNKLRGWVFKKFARENAQS